MRSITGNWFVCKVRYDKTQEEGLVKKVSEQYVFAAASFGDAEARVTEEMTAYISGDFEVQEIDRAPFKEVFFSDSESDDKWYKAKVAFITIDEVTAKEKRTKFCYLVQGGSLEAARKNIDEVFCSTAMDYEIVGLEETQIMYVYEHSKE